MSGSAARAEVSIPPVAEDKQPSFRRRSAKMFGLKRGPQRDRQKRDCLTVLSITHDLFSVYTHAHRRHAAPWSRFVHPCGYDNIITTAQ